MQSLPYAVSVTSQTTGRGQTDVVISGVRVAVSMVACSFTVTGAVPGFYANGRHTLAVTAKLPPCRRLRRS